MNNNEMNALVSSIIKKRLQAESKQKESNAHTDQVREILNKMRNQPVNKSVSKEESLKQKVSALIKSQHKQSVSSNDDVKAKVLKALRNQ